MKDKKQHESEEFDDFHEQVDNRGWQEWEKVAAEKDLGAGTKTRDEVQDMIPDADQEEERPYG